MLNHTEHHLSLTQTLKHSRIWKLIHTQTHMYLYNTHSHFQHWLACEAHTHSLSLLFSLYLSFIQSDLQQKIKLSTSETFPFFFFAFSIRPKSFFLFSSQWKNPFNAFIRSCSIGSVRASHQGVPGLILSPTESFQMTFLTYSSWMEDFVTVNACAESWSPTFQSF